MYKYIHSIHHRNTDIEPFAGLSMHPVEHLYYYSCVGPSFILFTSPFAFKWNAIHLLISPAASHSGWEDHIQSDQYHYLHHRYISCMSVVLNEFVFCLDSLSATMDQL